MPELILQLEGVAIVLNVAGQPFTLTAPTAKISASTGGGSGGSSSNQPPELDIHFKYEKSFEESLDLGTPGEVLDSIEELLANIPGSTPATLRAQWDTITQRLQKVPVLDKVSNAALNTQVRMTRFEIHFSRVPILTPTEYWANFTLGLVFVPQPGSLPTLLNTTLTRFGAVLAVTGRGKATDFGLPA